MLRAEQGVLSMTLRKPNGDGVVAVPILSMTMMPDTPSCQSEYFKPSYQQPGLRRPVARGIGRKLAGTIPIPRRANQPCSGGMRRVVKKSMVCGHTTKGLGRLPFRLVR